jgi:N-acetylneuraminic acid mutarotase
MRAALAALTFHGGVTRRSTEGLDMGVFVRKAALGAVLASLVALALAGVAQAAWSPVGALSGGRYNHTATLLNDGRVLVAGGSDSTALGSAQLYDPTTATWSNAAPMSVARAGQAAVRLDSGKVLVAGGVLAGGTTYTGSAEVYDSSTNTWVRTADDMAAARFQPTMTVLKDGRVLVAGGAGGSSASPLASAEIYNPATNSFSPAAPMSAARANATATLLPSSGEVLVAGGYDDAKHELSSAELYDPAHDSWAKTGSLATARDAATATALQDGDVLVAGGDSGAGHALASAEVYDAGTGTWHTTAGDMTDARQAAAAALLDDGTVLVTGGESARSGGEVLASAERYDPSTDAWTPAGTLAAARKEHMLTALDDGRALVVGGNPGGRDRGLTGVERFSTVTATLTDATFGTQLVGSTSDVVKSVLTNTSPGSQALHVTGVSIAGGDFAIVDDSCTGATVVPGATCEVSVQFSPLAGGTRSGTLTVTDNNTAAGATTAALRGTGDAPAPAGGDASGGGAGGGSAGAAAPAASAIPGAGAAVAGTTAHSGSRSAVRPGTRATCVAKTKSGRSTVTCRVTWPTRAAVALNARLMRGSTKLATASATARGGHATITLRPSRRLRSGRYTIVLARRGGAPVLRQGLRVS